MMPMSQIDMVVFKQATSPQASTLEVCGKFERRRGNAPPPTKGEVFVVVRQGDFVQALQGPTKDETRWELSRTLEPGQGLALDQPVLVSGALVLPQEDPAAGLEIVSWVQEVAGTEIQTSRTPAPPNAPAHLLGTTVGDGQSGGLTTKASVASSLAIHQAPAAGGEPLSWRQQVERVPVRHAELGDAEG
jgi:hypothetical protein